MEILLFYKKEINQIALIDNNLLNWHNYALNYFLQYYGNIIDLNDFDSNHDNSGNRKQEIQKWHITEDGKTAVREYEMKKREIVIMDLDELIEFLENRGIKKGVLVIAGCMGNTRS